MALASGERTLRWRRSKRTPPLVKIWSSKFDFSLPFSASRNTETTELRCSCRTYSCTRFFPITISFVKPVISLDLAFQMLMFNFSSKPCK